MPDSALAWDRAYRENFNRFDIVFARLFSDSNKGWPSIQLIILLDMLNITRKLGNKLDSVRYVISIEIVKAKLSYFLEYGLFPFQTQNNVILFLPSAIENICLSIFPFYFLSIGCSVSFWKDMGIT